MTDQPTKSSSKQKKLIHADLNFVSQYRMDAIIEQIESIGNRAIIPTIVRLSEDTVLFQIDYVRKDKTTASLQGRLRRWAGDMTHVYCDGRARKVFRPPWRTLIWRGIVLWFASPFVLFFLARAATDTALYNTLVDLFFFSLVTIILAGTIGGVLLFLWMLIKTFVLQEDSIFISRQAQSKPNEKDRERLLHALTNIIADQHLPPARLHADVDMYDDTPLSEREWHALTADARQQSS